MFPSIDTPMLALARAIIQLTLAGLIICTGSRQQRRMGTHWWAWGLALHGIGLLVFLLMLQATLADAPRKEMAGIYRSLRRIVSAYAVLLLWSYGRAALPNCSQARRACLRATTAFCSASVRCCSCSHWRSASWRCSTP